MPYLRQANTIQYIYAQPSLSRFFLEGLDASYKYIIDYLLMSI